MGKRKEIPRMNFRKMHRESKTLQTSQLYISTLRNTCSNEQRRKKSNTLTLFIVACNHTELVKTQTPS